MKDKKIIVFEHQRGWGDHNVCREEFEFNVDATDEEIREMFEDWVWERIGNEFSWSEKE